MAGYIGSRAAVATSGVERKKTFAITTTTTSLTGLDYTPNHVHVFHNGIRLVDGTDYTATNGTSITLVNAAENGDEVVVVSYGTFSPADTYTKSETYTKTEADDRYVNASGDTMTGQLDVDANVFGRAFEFRAGSNALTHGVAIHSTEANALQINTSSVERFKIDGNGRVTMPYQPFFKARPNGSFNVTTTGDILPFTVVDTNIGANYNSTNSRFTAPVSGSYVFYVMTFIPPNTSRFAYFRINGGRHTSIEDRDVSGNYTNRSDVYPVYLSAGDYVDIEHTSGTTHLNGNYGGPESFFSGYLIG